MEPGTRRSVIIGLLVAALLVASGSAVYLTVAPRFVVISHTTWNAVWATNGTAATIPGTGDYRGGCWNLTNSWVPGMMLTCSLMFDSGTFGPLPASEKWNAVQNVSVASPFGFFHAYAVGYHVWPNGAVLTVLELHLKLPSNPGTYDFSGTLTVST